MLFCPKHNDIMIKHLPLSATGAAGPFAPSKQAIVPFVSVANMLRLIDRIGIETVLVELSDAIESDFLRWPEFDKVARVASHSTVGVIELMPTADATTYGFKYVNGHPGNTRLGLQTVSAFGLLADVATGYPLLLTEMTVLTALRTAATSAMGARHLARPQSRILGMIGNGAQAEFQIMAMKAVLGIETVRLYDIDPEATAKVVRNLRGSGLELISCASSMEAVEGVDIVTTCTADKQYATILTDNMVGAGMHINAIGGDCPGKTELHRDILNRSKVFVEYTPQSRIEGEIQQMPEEFPVTELWTVIAGQASGRRDENEITLFDSVGFAIEDFSALRYLQSRIREHPDLTEALDMLADPDDPRDLFGMYLRSVGDVQK